MQDSIAQALASLVQLPLTGAERSADMISLRFGAPGPDRAGNGDGPAPALSLHVSCPWRLADGERVLVGSGDLLTPADPDADLETFDWEPHGASWLDVRLAELAVGRLVPPPEVETVAADPFGGVRIALATGLALELFPNSTPTGHVATEFWRLVREDADAAEAFVVGTFGVEREPAT